MGRVPRSMQMLTKRLLLPAVFVLAKAQDTTPVCPAGEEIMIAAGTDIQTAAVGLGMSTGNLVGDAADACVQFCIASMYAMYVTPQGVRQYTTCYAEGYTVMYGAETVPIMGILILDVQGYVKEDLVMATPAPPLLMATPAPTGP